MLLRLVIERKRRGISQRRLSELTRLDQPRLSRIENGRYRPYLGEMRKIAEALGFPLDRMEELFTEFGEGDR